MNYPVLDTRVSKSIIEGYVLLALADIPTALLLGKEGLTTIVHVLIIFQLDYCTMSLPLKIVQELKFIPNAAMTPDLSQMLAAENSCILYFFLLHFCLLRSTICSTAFNWAYFLVSMHKSAVLARPFLINTRMAF